LGATFSEVKENIGRVEVALKKLGIEKAEYNLSEASNSQELKNKEGNRMVN